MDEQKKYEVIKKLVETNGNKTRAAVAIGCSKRHINRLIKGYKAYGKEFFVHGNRDRKPSHALSDEIKQSILDFYKTKYSDANFTHFSELLMEYEGITVSPSTVRNILMEEGILSPKAVKATRKAAILKLEAQKQQSSSKKEIAELQEAIMQISNPHPRRPRCQNFGEMIQLDASVHLWFGKTKTG